MCEGRKLCIIKWLLIRVTCTHLPQIKKTQTGKHTLDTAPGSHPPLDKPGSKTFQRVTDAAGREAAKWSFLQPHLAQVLVT